MTWSRRIPIVSIAVVASSLALGAAWAETPDISTPKSDGAKCARDKFRVVLDVGHTADAPGASSARGVDEYVFNLRLAKVIDQKMIDAGFNKTVLMVTGGPGNKSMYERVGRANGLSPDLLLSIHHDSVPDKFKEKWEYDGKPAVFSDQFSGHSIFVSDNNVHLQESLLFGHLLGEQLKSRGMQYTPHYTKSFMGRYQRQLLDADAGVYRYDTLFVLKKSQMPAVLLEAGSIVNRDEELLMASPERQLQISAAVIDAVDAFCVAQSTRQPQVAQSTGHLPQVAQSARRMTQVAHSVLRHRPKQTAAAAAPTTPMGQSSLDAH
jgi:N-acetylmuramoyl-L-alanine amidase